MPMRFLFFFGFVLVMNVSLAQTAVALRIDHKAGQAEFGGESSVVTPLGETVVVDRLEYYLSKFILVHDGGQETAIQGAYVLGDAFVDELHALGEVPAVESVESLKFSVGIDPENNHADPATWPEAHPLAPQVPSMHWGWSAGYRFIALEGGAGVNGLVNHEIHALGDDNHFPGQMEVLATIENGVLVLDVEADILGFYSQLSVESGLINHGENGEAILVCNNLADDVFRLPGAASVASEVEVSFDFDLAPKEGGALLRFDAPLTESAEVILLDILGRPLQSVLLPSGTKQHALIHVQSGAFLVTISTGSRRTTRRWIQG